MSRAAIVLTIIVYFLVFWVGLPVFLLATGLRLDYLWPVEPNFPTASGIVVAILGVIIMAPAMRALVRDGQGLPVSHLPPEKLVTTTVYRYVRHPIYVGYTVLFAGVCVIIDSFWCLMFSVPLLIAGWLAYILLIEEPTLHERFGEAYERYRQSVGLFLSGPERRKAARRQWAARISRLLCRAANRTVLFQRGNLIFVTYGLYCAAGGLIFAASTAILLAQQGYAPSEQSFFIAGMALAVSFFAWFFWWLGHFRSLRKIRWYGLGSIGFVSYGGLFGIGLFIAAFSFFSRKPLLAATDAVMQGLLFAYVIGRAGCLTFGCCYGSPTSSPLFVEYRNPSAKVIRLGDTRRVRRHPTPLYAMIHGVIVLVIVNMMAWFDIPAGLITAMTLLLFGVGRTFTESFRDRERVVFHRFTWGHLGAWITFLIGWILLFITSPGSGNSPSTWTMTGLEEALPVLPVVLLAGLFVFVVFGVHRGKIGTWIVER